MARPAAARPRALAGLAFLLALFATPARADRITPDSIVRPPPGGVPGVPDTAVAAQDLVTGQYEALGLRFPLRPGAGGTGYATAVTSVNGVHTWAGVLRQPDGAGWVNRLTFGALAGVAGELVTPANHLRVSFELSAPGFAFLAVKDVHGQSTFVSTHELATRTFAELNVPGIVSFEARAIPSVVTITPSCVGPTEVPPFTWGVSEVEFTRGPVAHAPEPAALTLAGLGLLGLLGLARRGRTVAQGKRGKA